MNAEQKKFGKVIKARRRREAWKRNDEAQKLRLKRRTAEIRRSLKERMKAHKEGKVDQKGITGGLRKFFKL